MWFAENISWRQFRRSLGSFSAIVCKDASTVWAEDSEGKTIASGEAGVDDASVIQDAISEIESGVIFIMPATYLIDSEIALPESIDDSNIVVRGGGTTTILKATTSVNSIINMGLQRFAVVEDLRILCDNKAAYGIYFPDTRTLPNYSIIRSILIYGATKAAIRVFHDEVYLRDLYINTNNKGVILETPPESLTDIRMENCKIYSTTSNPIEIQQGVGKVTIRDCVFAGNSDSILVDNDDTCFEHCWFENQQEDKAYIKLGSAFSASKTRIIDCHFNANNKVTYPIHLVDVRRCIISQCSFTHLIQYAIRFEANCNYNIVENCATPDGYLGEEHISDDGGFNILISEGKIYCKDFRNKEKIEFYVPDSSGNYYRRLVILAGDPDTAVMYVDNAHFLPHDDNQYNLGDDTHRWRYARFQKTKSDHIVIPTSAPGSPESGSMYFDPSTGTLYIYDGSTWKSVSLT